MKQIVPPTALIGSFSGFVPPAKGGTGGSDVASDVAALGLYPKSTIGLANGAVPLDATGKVSSTLLSNSLVQPANIQSTTSPLTTSVMALSVSTWKITNYDSRLTYTVAATGGSATISGDTITYTAPSTASSTSGFTVNGNAFVMPTVAATPTAPVIQVPVAASAVYGPSVYPVTAAFASIVASDTHASTDWQIASDSAFSTIIASSTADTVNKLTWAVTTGLAISTTYYLRARHNGSVGGASPWSVTRSFVTKAVFRADLAEAMIVASDKATGDQFGWGTAMSGDGTRLVVGARLGDPLGLVDAGAAYVFFRVKNVWTQEAKLTASDGITTDLFGANVAISNDGTRVAVGVPQSDPGGTSNAGAVYVFSRSGTTWSQEAKLQASDKSASAFFGQSMSLTNDASRIAIGAQQADPGAVTDSGAVYVFSRSSTTWTQEQILSASDKATSWALGISTSITADGSRIAVSAAPPSAAGAVYVFLRAGTTWTQEAKLSGSDTVSGDNFGCSVSFAGEGARLTVGANLAVVNNFTQAGAAYVFVRNATTWTQEAKLVAQTPAKVGYFGGVVFMNADGSKVFAAQQTVPLGLAAGVIGPVLVFQRTTTTWAYSYALTPSGETATEPNFGVLSGSYDGTRIAAGAWAGNASSIVNAGNVSIFAEGTVLVPEVMIYPSDKVTGDAFAFSVSLSTDGSRISVGAYGSDPGGTSNAGAVYIFLKTGSTWVQEAKLVASDKVAGDNFGVFSSITADGTRVVVSSQNRTESGITNAGAAYIFSRSGSTWTQEQKITASDKATGWYFGICVAISGDGTRLIAGSQAAAGGLNNTGAGYVFVRSGTTWTQEAILTASDKAASDFTAQRVAICIDGSRIVLSSYANDQAFTDAGAAYVFSRSGVTWTQEQKLSAADPAAGDHFGNSVAMNSDCSRVVCGANLKTVNGFSSAGAAYILIRSGTSWSQEAKIICGDPVASGNFGNSTVAMDSAGSTVIIGEAGSNPYGISGAGAAYKFTRNGTAWTQIQKYIASNRAASDNFGLGVGISPDGLTVCIGAFQGDGGGTTDCGTAYIYV